MRKAWSPSLDLLLFQLVMGVALPFMCHAQNDPTRNSALLPESWARKSAITKVMPSYPDEAAQGGVAGVVRIRFETTSAGEVVKIKVKPGTDPLLKRAVIDAMKQWTFRPWRGADGLEVPVFSRMAFQFIIRGDKPQVEMYKLGSHSPGDLCLACSNSFREMIEWNEWEAGWSRSESKVDVPITLNK